MGSSGGLPGIQQSMAYVATVTLTIGLGLFLLPPYGQMPLAHQLALTATALTLWSFSDGLFGRFSLPLALMEAVLLLRVAVGWTRLMVDTFGVPAPELEAN
jgi:hypothetical protein